MRTEEKLAALVTTKTMLENGLDMETVITTNKGLCTGQGWQVAGVFYMKVPVLDGTVFVADNEDSTATFFYLMARPARSRSST